MNNTKVVLNGEKLSYACELMRALAHPLRLRILQYINRNEDTSVNEIYRNLGIEQSVTSQHLKILKTAGVLSCEKDGKFMYYTINYEIVEKAEAAVNRYTAKAS